MANISAHITAGLPYPKDSGQSPTVGATSSFVTAGLPKVVESPPAAGGINQIIGNGIIQ